MRRFKRRVITNNPRGRKEGSIDCLGAETGATETEKRDANAVRLNVANVRVVGREGGGGGRGEMAYFNDTECVF